MIPERLEKEYEASGRLAMAYVLASTSVQFFAEAQDLMRAIGMYRQNVKYALNNADRHFDAYHRAIYELMERDKMLNEWTDVRMSAIYDTFNNVIADDMELFRQKYEEEHK